MSKGGKKHSFNTYLACSCTWQSSPALEDHPSCEKVFTSRGLAFPWRRRGYPLMECNSEGSSRWAVRRGAISSELELHLSMMSDNRHQSSSSSSSSLYLEKRMRSDLNLFPSLCFLAHLRTGRHLDYFC